MASIYQDDSVIIPRKFFKQIIEVERLICRKILIQFANSRFIQAQYDPKI